MALEDYTPQTDFSQDETNQVAGRSTVRTSNLDAEFANLKTSIDSIIARLQSVTRDDAELADEIVTYESLSPVVVSLLGSSGYNPRGAWLTTTSYAQKDVVTNGTGTYVCVTAHTSGTFATDLAAGKWLEIWNSAMFAATAVTFTPTGGVSASNVQAAIAEVDSEKMAKSANGSDIADAATFRSNISVPSKADIQNQTQSYAADTGTADALAITMSPTVTAYVSGMRVSVKKSANANTTTTATLDIDGVGVKKIFKNGGSAIGVGDLKAGAHLDFEYDASYDSAAGGWEWVNSGAAFTSIDNAIFQLDASTLASAATIDIGTATGNTVTITHSGGTTATTSLGGASLKKGTVVKLIASISGGTWSMTHHATNLILAGGANITLANGDALEFVKMHDTNAEWKMVGGEKTNGLPWVGGKLAQSLTATTSSYVGLSATIPLDDTIPQNTEGTEILTQAITPKSASSTIRISARIAIASPVGSGGTFIAALFKDTTANALAANSVFCAAGGVVGHVEVSFEESAGSTSARTYKLRGGPSAAITMYYNGDASGRRFGGVSIVSMTVEEILP